MNTTQERLTAALERFRADMAARDRWLYGLVISILVAVVLILARSYFPGS